MMANPHFLLPACAAGLALTVALVVAARQPRLPQSWWFLASMLATGTSAMLDALALAGTSSQEVLDYHTGSVLVRTLLPGLWLGFARTFAQDPARPRSRRSLWLLAATFLVPVAIGFSLADQFVARAGMTPSEGFGVVHTPVARILHVALLAGFVVALARIEATFRASVGTTRWRLKYATLGMAVILGVHLYTQCQSVLFSIQLLRNSVLEAGGLLIGTTLLALSLLRQAFDPLDVLVLRSSIERSITVLVTGLYLFLVGMLAQAITLIGDTTTFQTQALLILLGIAALALLSLSDRLRQRIKAAFNRHFGRSGYDFRKLWVGFSRELSSQRTATGVSAAAARLIAENFSILSVRVWLLNDSRQRLILGASTATTPEERKAIELPEGCALASEFGGTPATRDLESATGVLADAVRAGNPSLFETGGRRLAVPLWEHDQFLGIVVLADRVNGAPYTGEELALFGCIATQISATLANLRITHELMQAKELEAFQTMSAFFVHDLKNAVSTLNLMLQNLPVHFANPEFREDALRGIGKTAERVNHLIGRLSALRRKLELQRTDCDLPALIARTLQELNGLPGVELTTDLQPIPTLLADPGHLGSVLSNLLINARDAIPQDTAGKVAVSTRMLNGQIQVSISDNGCGMTREFVENSLFRPFSSTKNLGLGIGMFQCKMIVEAHKGLIQVESEPGKGTTFRILLPLDPRPAT